MIGNIHFLYHSLGDFWFIQSDFNFISLNSFEMDRVVELLEEKDDSCFFEDYLFEIEIEY